jgi:hypothetical protein
VLDLDADKSVTGVFVPTQPAGVNIVFATSTTQNGNLGGLAGADQLCATRASAAGLTGNYVAWLSTSSVDAIDRLGGASGWVRPDGKPFANTPLSAIYYPIRQDEFGNELWGRQVFTGTDRNGTKETGSMCSDWAANTGRGRSGGTNVTHVSWTDHYGGDDACSYEQSIYCFGIDHSADVTPSSSSMRIAFLSDGDFSPGSGIAEADALCQTEATGAGLTGTFKALLATATESPKSRFNLTGSPWVRPDGAEIAATPQALFDQGVPDTTINMTLGGSYFSAYEWIWTGIGPAHQGLGMETPGTAATTCNSWNSSLNSDEGQSGYAGDTVLQFGVLGGYGYSDIPRDCDRSLRIYCLEN